MGLGTEEGLAYIYAGVWRLGDRSADFNTVIWGTGSLQLTESWAIRPWRPSIPG